MAVASPGSLPLGYLVLMSHSIPFTTAAAVFKRLRRFLDRFLRFLAPLCLTTLIMMAVSAAAETQDEGLQLLTITLTVPQLGREKRIWIYLPLGYSTDADKRFPVVYMQDGQYLFERLLHPSVSSLLNEALNRELQRGMRWYGNWQLDKRLDRLFARITTAASIIVGIASDSGNRTAEYSPWPWVGAPVPEGNQYLRFIVETLRPYIDGRYRILSRWHFQPLVNRRLVAH